MNCPNCDKPEPECQECKCGKWKCEHHDFAPIDVPAKCICDRMEWGDPSHIPAICGNFQPMTDEEDLCQDCQHEKGCHEGGAVEKS